MNLQDFSLIPFPAGENGPDIEITGSIGRRANLLFVGWSVRGDLSALEIPAPEKVPRRVDRLWEGFCLELFIGMKGSDPYWEFNFSPSGHWNVYRFASYREGMREEEAFASLPFVVRNRQEHLVLSVELGIDRIIPREKTMEAGVSAVVKTLGGGTSHWALAHPGTRPDFHLRDGFLLKI